MFKSVVNTLILFPDIIGGIAGWLLAG